MDYVIGMDTGASKSHLALFDTTGSLVDFGRWGPLNHEVLPDSFDQFHEEIDKFIFQILAKNNITADRITSAVFGIAGVDTKKQHKIISGIIKKTGFNNFTLVNDAFLGIPAGSPDGTGICAINGSGCTLAGINKEGRMLQIGGTGYISADFGGGGMLGEMAVSAVYSELFRRGEKTCMTAALMEKLGITEKADFVDRIYEKYEDGCFSAGSCNKLLFEAANKNDNAASRILRGCGTSYANGICVMLDDLNFGCDDDINIVFAGSVFVKGENPLIIDTIKQKIKAEYPGYKINYRILTVPPVAGAVFLALCNLGINDKNVYYDKVCSQLSNL